jgi:tetratricopeptide (TPR) repeat protein
VRGEAFELRDDPQARAALQRFELYGTLAIEYTSFAPVRGTLFQARALRHAYESGEPAALSRALSVAATIACISGTPRAARRAMGMLDRAAALSRQSSKANVRCELELHAARAICSMLLGRLPDVIVAADEAARIYEGHSGIGEHGEYYHMFSVHAARLGALQNLGHNQKAATELARVLDLAKTSDNRTALLLMTVPVTMAEQAADRCAHSRERLREERRQLPSGEFAIAHLQHLIATMRAATITADFDWVVPILEQDWPRYLKSHVYRGAYMAYVAHTTHARLMLNRHVMHRDGDPERLVHDDLRGLARLPHSGFTSGSLCRHRARIAWLRGDRERAIELLRQSVQALSSVGFHDESERDRCALGAAIGGDEGAQLKADCLTNLRDLGCSDPLGELLGYFPELFAGSEVI